MNDDVDGPETKEVTVTGTGPTDRSDITVAGPVTLTITDNDTRGVTLTRRGGSRFRFHRKGCRSRKATTDSYTVVLDSQPTAPVDDCRGVPSDDDGPV